jgi:hypothetical protein
MKKILLTALLLTGLGVAQAADNIRLYASNLGNGISAANGSAVSSGTVRFGYFPAGYDITANAQNFASLDASFVQVHSFSGSISTQSTGGFFDIAVNGIVATGSLDGVAYDNSPGVVNDVAGDIAGERIYVWIMNNPVPASATEQAIFSIDQTWPDKDGIFTDVTVSIDSGVNGLTAHLGALAAGPDLGAGAFSHSMANPIGSAVATRSPAGSQIFVGTRVAFSVDVGGTGPFDYQWRKNGVDIAGATNATYLLTPAQLSDDGNYSVEVTNAVGSVVSNLVNLDVFTISPVVTRDPSSEILLVGDILNLGIEAEGEALKYSWKRNNAVLKGYASPTLQLGPVTTANAGSYTATASNSHGSDTSIASFVAVVSDAPTTLTQGPGTVATMKVVTAGSFLSYQWFKGSSLLANGLQSSGATVSGAMTATLVVSDLTANDSGTYRCLVSGPGGEVYGGTHTLNVFTAGPDLLTQNMPDGIIGGDYFHQIVIDTASGMAPTGYTVTGLPTGLKADLKTGIISGRPTKTGMATITIVARNSEGSDTTTEQIEILAFPSNLAGSYVGMVERNEDPDAVLGGNLGGRIEMTVATTGAVSGKIFLGALSYPLKGFINVPVQTPASPVVVPATLTVVRSGLLPLTISFNLTGSSVITPNLLTEGEITDGANEPLEFDGWRNIWSTASPADHYLGLYNFGIGLIDGSGDEEDPSIPQGLGYASFTVAKDGKLKIAGKTADGEILTSATFMGPTGQVFFFQPLYKTVEKGSILGEFDIDPLNVASTADNTLAGDASWSRPATPALNHRLYRDGFGPIDLMVVGGRYDAPVAPTLLLGLTNGNDNAQLVFENGGLPENGPGPTLVLPSVKVSVQTGNKTVIATNGTLTKMSAVAKSGLFSGTYTLTDADPRAGFTAPVKRNVKFQGLIIPAEGGLFGVGYALIDQLPTDGPPATTPTTSPTLSAGAFFEPTPIP